MTCNPCENDQSERGEEETGQEPKEPSQSDSVTEDKDKGQKEIGNNEGIKENKKEIVDIGKGNKKVWVCGICITKVNKGSVKCTGCSKWIHRRYGKNKPNCSGLEHNDDYILGIYRCPNCVDHVVKRRGPGRPVKPKNAVRIGTQRRQKRYASGIPIQVTKRGKRKAREVVSPKKSKDIEKKEDEKSPSKKKPKTDGNSSVEDEEVNDKTKTTNKKCLKNKTSEKGNQEEKPMTEGEANKAIGKNEGEKSPTTKKPKTDGNNDGKDEEVSDKEKNTNKKCLINKMSEKSNQEEKSTAEGEANRVIPTIQASKTLTTIEGIPISVVDRRSLDYGKRVTCTIISMYMKFAESLHGNELKKNKILLLQPAIVQILQLYKREDVKEQKKQLKMENYDWIFFPVSDRKNTMDGDGGSHFSLAIYSRKEHRFFHFDPIRGLNRKSALDLMTNLLDSESVINEGNLYKLPDFEEAFCIKQKDSFNCGPFILGYMEEAIDTIVEGNTPRELSGPVSGATKVRNDLAEVIDYHANKNHNENNQATEENANKQTNKQTNQERFKLDETDKENNDKISKMIEEVRRDSEENETKIMEVEEEVIEVFPKSNEEPKKKDQDTKKIDTIDEEKKTNNNQMNKDKKICHFWATEKCKFGQNCNYEHPARCIYHMERGICKKKGCKLLHPKMCRNMVKDRYCSRPKCWFNHPTKIKNSYVHVNENHGHGFNQGQRGPSRQVNQSMHGNQNKGYPVHWQNNHWQNNHMNGNQYPNNTPFLAGPTPSGAYRDPNRDMNMIRKMGNMFQEMSTQIIQEMSAQIMNMY